METPFMIWSDEYAVGHDSLDAEHRQMVDAINAIHSAVGARQPHEKISQALEALKQVTDAHLKHENLVLRKINSGPIPSVVTDKIAFLKAMVEAAIEAHVANHRQSFSDLNEIIRRFQSAFEPNAEKMILALKSWFVDHALEKDAHLRPVFRSLSPSQ